MKSRPLFALLILLLSHCAWGEVTLKAVSPHEVYETSDGREMVFYALASSSNSGYVIDDGFSRVSTTAGTGGIAVSDSRAIVYFKMSSDQEFAVGSGQRLVLSAYVRTGSGANDYSPVPIAKYNGFDCATSICQKSTSGNTNGLFIGANLGTSGTAGATETVIGLYIRDLCAYGSAGTYAPSSNEQLCGGASFSLNAPTSTAYRTADIKFVYGVVSDAASAPSLTTGTVDRSNDLSVRVKAEAPTLTCPSREEQSLLYFPGDGEIQFETGYFKISDSVSGAIADKILILAKSGGASPDVSTFSANDFVARLPVQSGTQKVEGFKNISSESDATNTYQLWFGIRDISGAVSTPSASCGLTSVRTSAIAGFLQKGSCFIATATFRDPNAYSVRLLRQFRDQALSRMSLGRWMIRKYNSLSPPAAEWLMRNPEFRVFSFAFLSPFILFAFIVVHPLWALSGFGALIGTLFGLGVLRRRRAT